MDKKTRRRRHVYHGRTVREDLKRLLRRELLKVIDMNNRPRYLKRDPIISHFSKGNITISIKRVRDNLWLVITSWGPTEHDIKRPKISDFICREEAYGEYEIQCNSLKQGLI